MAPGAVPGGFLLCGNENFFKRGYKLSQTSGAGPGKVSGMKRRHFLSLATFAALPRVAHAADAVRIIEQDWNDSTRNRVVPVRIYLPAVENAAGKASVPLPLILFSH